MKKVGSVFCIVLLISILTISQLPAEPCGDTNSSGTIDIVDALLIAQYYVGVNPSNFDREAGDVNSDGAADIIDALLVAQYYVELIDTLSCQTVQPTPGPGDLSSLPDLSMNPAVSQLKAWVREVYDLFPQFKNMYETELAITKDEALAFHFACMSRESGKDGYWQMDLETGIGSAGHAWGPFQAAVTNFIGGGYDHDILDRLGMPTPDISQFKVPPVSTYAGMKRLVEGIEEARINMGYNRSTVEFLLGSLAHHNTGYATLEIITNEGWLQNYGNEVFRMMQGYLAGDHMTDDKAYWTSEPIPYVDAPWSGGK
ncbi:MAG: hypothetical protein JXJ04_04145 [Spirochaetales bacterium]|nr:hypothetical protein [Spirochaetales bacterium]